jgi:hypothetical protein
MIKAAAIRSQFVFGYCSIEWRSGPSRGRVYTVLSGKRGSALSNQNEAAPREPPSPSIIVSKAKRGWPTILSLVLVCALVVATVFGIWHLQPKQIPQGRPIGEVGKVEAFASPVGTSGEGLSVWRNGHKTFELSEREAVGIERFELSSTDVDVAGSSDPDLVLYAWTGGAHCCFSQWLFDGRTGRKLGKFDIGNGDPTPFIPTQAKGLARAVSVNVDDVTAFKFGAYSETPMARILVVWDGQRFALDLKRMKAATADSPPSYYVAEPDLADVVPLTNFDAGIDETTPPAASKPSLNVRGERARTYQNWMVGLEARMLETKIDANDPASFGPMTSFLNEQIYKGQGRAAVAKIDEAFKDRPDEKRLALKTYGAVISQSRWINDLNKLNDGLLTNLIEAMQSENPAVSAPSTQR